MKKYAAIDLGASGGRVIVGDLSSIEVVARFPSKAVRTGDSLFWDILWIFDEIKKGLREAFRLYGNRIVSIGIDTWGVDYAFVDQDGDLLGNPYHYRDERTNGIMESFFEAVPRETVYRETGIQFMQFNTLFQLYAEKLKKGSRAFRGAGNYLSVPDLLNFWLTGVKKNEYTHFSTTQLYNPGTKKPSSLLLEALGLDPEIFPEPAPSGTVLGPLLPAVAREIGAPRGVVVIAPGCHDTASAVAAVPASGEKEYAYLSSGTWSLLGIESKEPIITPESYKSNFTNEGAVDGGVRFLKNIMGLWIIQECKAHWDKTGTEMDWPEIARLAKESRDTGVRINVDDDLFLASNLTSSPMCDRVQQYCRHRGDHVPHGTGEIALCVFKSLAEAYGRVTALMEECSGRKIEELYIIGGGCRNDYLCELTARELGRPVFSGPAEATALGNILVQAQAQGDISGLSEGRRLIAGNFEIQEFLPGQ